MLKRHLFRPLLLMASVLVGEALATPNPYVVEARAHFKRQDYTKALARMNVAVQDAPRDARLRSEYGWMAFKAGKIRLSAEQLKRALKLAEVGKDRNLMGQVLYNLGRLGEYQRKFSPAITLYEQSLLYRKNTTVRRRISTTKAQIRVSNFISALNQGRLDKGMLSSNFKAYENGVQIKKLSRLKTEASTLSPTSPHFEGISASFRNETNIKKISRMLKSSKQRALVTVSGYQARTTYSWYFVVNTNFDKIEALFIRWNAPHEEG